MPDHAIPDRPPSSVDRTPAAVGEARHVVIVGAGFGGLACAQALAGSEVRVTVVDRRNHHLFQPLLYQVATAALSPADIASPIRSILSRAANIDVVMGEVRAMDHAERRVLLADGGHIPYDTLVLATGSVYNYFGHDEWARHAPGLKSIRDARRLRARLLRSFEEAESCAVSGRRSALLTTVIVGGGPTGVEMAGAVAELARFTLRRDFRRIDSHEARIILVEAGPRLLAALSPESSDYAATSLHRLGVEVRLGAKVTDVSEGAVTIDGAQVEAATLIWAAGIRALEPASLGFDVDRAGRIEVADDLSVPGLADVFALGDAASFRQDDGPLPALAQVARQQGTHLGQALLAGTTRPFRYVSRGDTAVIGRHAAVFETGRWRLRGRFAWFLWALVHIYLLIGFEKRLQVGLKWLWRYATFERGARLIDEEEPATRSGLGHSLPDGEQRGRRLGTARESMDGD
ncbi:NAD(P)/FAD-dependent oxidoreductase [Reyranella sp.]|uniref:NAD(P)/FAD-dependent oxidoreductase n=1 Tax=Reyranella sp. TaxID=1929291 RepID=UPI002612C5F4|nr:NAD(P)/FAD-dependent oxidoreductase [Reyranella sp.]HQS19122.1 NAD(P)/FAD-dependent oxidoreductase [Reyranella sp.]HQT15314.1 NAD(P)/FAD-dependent oxidoreductase [Reyranella sp.]